jgi:hypothetical protein
VYKQAAVIFALACQKGRDGKIVLLYDLECCMLYPISGLGSENSKSVEGSNACAMHFLLMHVYRRPFVFACAGRRARSALIYVRQHEQNTIYGIL